MAEIFQTNIITKIIDAEYKHGVYLYQNKSFVSKLDVLDHALSIGDKAPLITFDFHDNVFSKLTKEPSSSLERLYVERARQLRDKYDHIILLYSGGADSHEILNTFLKNGIFLDEVQNLHPKKLTDGKIDVSNLVEDTSNVLAEHIVTAMPELKLLSEVSPKTKIRILDTTDSFMGIDDNYLSSYYNHFFNSFYSTQMNAVILDNENIELATKKKVCLLWGNNKPFVTIDKDDNFSYCFTDMQRQYSPWLSGQNSTPLHFESFYWSVDAPLIPLKQSHMIMRQVQMDMDQGNNYSYDIIRMMKVSEQQSWMKDIIYQYWNKSKYQAKINSVDWHAMDQNIYKYIPGIKDITIDKMKFYTNKYNSLGGSVDLGKPGLGVFYTKRHKIGKLIKNTQSN